MLWVYPLRALQLIKISEKDRFHLQYILTSKCALINICIEPVYPILSAKELTEIEKKLRHSF